MTARTASEIFALLIRNVVGQKVRAGEVSRSFAPGQIIVEGHVAKVQEHKLMMSVDDPHRILRVKRFTYIMRHRGWREVQVPIVQVQCNRSVRAKTDACVDEVTRTDGDVWHQYEWCIILFDDSCSMHK